MISSGVARRDSLLPTDGRALSALAFAVLQCILSDTVRRRAGTAACVTVLSLVTSASAIAQDTDRLPIWPVFSPTDDGPSFVVECRNTSASAVTSLNLGIELRIDGAGPEDGRGVQPGGVAGSGDVHIYPPASRWRVLVGLRGLGLGMRTRLADVDISVAKAVVLTRRRHLSEIRCAEHWSETMPFYWSPQ